MTSGYLKKGTSLELLTAAYFQAHGYLVRRGVVLSTSDGTADATDIDLLAIRFSVPLAEERVVADCKDRKKSRPFERILWTRGLATFAQANHAVVVLPHAPWQAREFASQGGIEILNGEQIESFLKNELRTYNPFGEAEPEMALQLEQTKKSIQYRDKELFREDVGLRHMLVTGQPLTNLNRIINLLSDSNRKLRQAASPDALRLRRYLYFNAAVTASVMLVRFAATSKWTPEKDWSDHARKRLTYGDVPPQKAKQLAAMALDTTFYNGLPTPEYTEEIVSLIKAYISQPLAASIAPYVIDFQLFGRILRGLPRDYANPVLVGQEDGIRLARKTLSVLSYAAGVPPSIWSADDPWASRHEARRSRPEQPSLNSDTAAIVRPESEGSVPQPQTPSEQQGNQIEDTTPDVPMVANSEPTVVNEVPSVEVETEAK